MLAFLRPRYALLVVAGCVAALAIVSSGSAQTTGGPRTFTLYEVNKDSYNAFIDNKPIGPFSKKHGPHISRGDLIAFDYPLVDAQGTTQGHLDVTCTDTVPGRFDSGAIFACSGGARLADGTITVQTITSVTAKVTNVAITGGTGAYAGANGNIVSTTLSDTRSEDVVTLQ